MSLHLNSQQVHQTIIDSGVGQLLVEEWYRQHFPHQSVYKITAEECQFSLQLEKLDNGHQLIFVIMSVPQMVEVEPELQKFKMRVSRGRHGNPDEESFTTTQMRQVIGLLPGTYYPITRVHPDRDTNRCLISALHDKWPTIISLGQVPPEAIASPENYCLKKVTLHGGTRNSITHAFVVLKT